MIKKTLLFSNPAYLSLHLGQLVIEQLQDNERKRSTRPIEDIGLIVIESQAVTLTSALLSRLLESNVAVVTCDNRHLPNGMMLNLSGNTLQSERFQSQIGSSLPLRKQMWQQTVAAKLKNQALVLEKCSCAEAGCMKRWAENVRSGDPTNLEARGAVYYWKNLFPMISGFRRDPDGDSPNSLLNYGYSIIRATVARALVGSGLLPTLGIHHKNRYNAYCLADDIMEPYRPYVDRRVLELVRIQGREADLDIGTKTILLNLLTDDVEIGGVRRPLMVAISTTASSVAKVYGGEMRKISYPEIIDKYV